MSSCCTPGLYVGATGRILRSIKKSFEPDTSVYASDEGMTSDELAFDCAVAQPGRTGNLETVIIRETAASGSPPKGDMRLVFTTADPAVTAHGAYTVADLSAVLGVVDIATADFVDLDSSHAIAQLAVDINLPLGTGTTVWVAALARAATTYAASANIEIELQIISD